MVTSSAVVGSSAIRIFGRQARAMAIMIRWRMPPGQLVRVLVQSLLRIADAHPFKQLQRTRARLGAAQAVMHPQGFADLFTDPEHRIEGGHRLLEDHGDLLAADPVHLALTGAGQILAVKQDPPAGDAAGRVRDQLEDRQGGQALAAAGFADDAKHLTRRE